MQQWEKPKLNKLKTANNFSIKQLKWEIYKTYAMQKMQMLWQSQPRWRQKKFEN